MRPSPQAYGAPAEPLLQALSDCEELALRLIRGSPVSRRHRMIERRSPRCSVAAWPLVFVMCAAALVACGDSVGSGPSGGTADAGAVRRVAGFTCPDRATGAGAERAGPARSGRLRRVTTVAPLTSIISNVAGERADVVGIVPEGTNSHIYEPKPSVAAELSRADVVFVNGLKLEDPTL